MQHHNTNASLPAARTETYTDTHTPVRNKQKKNNIKEIINESAPSVHSNKFGQAQRTGLVMNAPTRLTLLLSLSDGRKSGVKKMLDTKATLWKREKKHCISFCENYSLVFCPKQIWFHLLVKSIFGQNIISCA